MIACTRKHRSIISVYSATHFIMDFACAFFMFRSIAGTPDGYLCVLLYNYCAFAMQMPIGVVADRLNKNFLFAVIGCILAGTAYALISFPITAVVVLGTGNAMFHIGGGIDVLNISEEKLGALGIFVSPGAFGIYFGTMLGMEKRFPSIFFPLALIAAAGLIFVMYKAQKGTYPQNAAFSLKGAGSPQFLAAIACLFLVVCLRSFVGLSLDFIWKSTARWGTVLICAIVFGKTMGGFAADRFGLAVTSFVSLGFAVLLFLFSAIPHAGAAAVFLFNMTMPVTLWAAAKIMPGARGFAFGLLSFGLFLGFLPVFIGIDVSAGIFWFFALISAASLVLLLAGLRGVKR